MHWFERIAQRRIDEAAAKGQLQGLPGEGRPLNPERLRESSDDGKRDVAALCCEA